MIALCLLLGQLSSPVWEVRERAENTLRSHHFSVSQWQALRVARFEDPEVDFRFRFKVLPHWTKRVLESRILAEVRIYPDVERTVGWKVQWSEDLPYSPSVLYYRGDIQRRVHLYRLTYVAERMEMKFSLIRYLQATGDIETVRIAVMEAHEREGSLRPKMFTLFGVGCLYQTWVTPNAICVCPQVFLPLTREVIP